MRLPGVALVGAVAVLSVGVAILVFDRGASDSLPGGVEPLPDPTSADFRSKDTAGGTKYWPRSAPIEQGVEYRFNTGHCGLEFMTDFDGSFWTPERFPPRKEPDFYYNEDVGTMELVSEDQAIYRSDGRGSASLTRHPGPLVMEGACA